MIDTLEIESDTIYAEIRVEFHHVDASFSHLFGIKYEFYYELDDYRTAPGQDMEDMRESL